MGKIPPKDNLRLFTVPLCENTFANLETMANAGHFGRTINDVARLIIEQWSHDSEGDFFDSYGLSLNDAMHRGYCSTRASKIIMPMPVLGQVYVGLRGRPRYLVEMLPGIEPTMDTKNPYFMPNEFYQKTPQAIIASVLDQLSPGFAKEAVESSNFDDDENDGEFAS